MLRDKQRITAEKEKLYDKFPQQRREELLKQDEQKQLQRIREMQRKDQEDAYRAYELKSKVQYKYHSLGPTYDQADAYQANG